MTHSTARLLLQLGSLGVVALGAMAALACHPATSEPWRLLVDVIEWPLDGHPAGFSVETMQVYPVLGGVLVGWGLTLALLARGALSGVDRAPVASAALIGLVVWFVVDSLGSWVSGLNGNIVLNALSLIAMAPPLWVLSRPPRSSQGSL